MSKSARRLGRGLSSLVSSTTIGAEAETVVQPKPASEEVTSKTPAPPKTKQTPLQTQKTAGTPGLQAVMVPIDDLNPNPHQPRSKTTTANVTSLAASIKKSGLLQPVTARIVDGRYEIIAGERRWRAAKSLGVADIPVLVREATDQQMIELALVENIQREDLNAMERARAYREFCDHFDLRPEVVAERLGEDRTTVVNYLRLLDLSDSIQAMVAQRHISMGHARCLLGMTDLEQREILAKSVVANGLSVRALEEIVRREKTRQQEDGDKQEANAAATVDRSPHVRDMENRFEAVTKTKVRIRESRRKGRGRIIIDYYTLDDFDRIAEQLGVEFDNA